LQIGRRRAAPKQVTPIESQLETPKFSPSDLPIFL